MEIKLYFFDRIYFVYDCQAWLSVLFIYYINESIAEEEYRIH